ncbi:MAG TPA: ATP-binding cassette domain-containing protein [Geminicoccaceae bacterium]|nr:ATP-binding cassette domain-containing protein [Geminicoccaceae bacterium]
MRAAGDVLAVAGIDVVDGQRWVVREVDLAVEPGSVVAIVGGPAAGKSGLLETIAGIRRPQRGQILFAGRDVTDAEPARRLALGIACSAQRPAAFAGLTVGEHLLLGQVPRRCSAGVAREGVLTLVPELAGRERDMPAALDRATLRLLDIGRALMSAPSLVLLDEPALDLGEERVAELVEAMREQGAGVLLAERYPGSALALADYAYLMVEGRLLLQGQPSLLRDDERVHAACVGESVEPLRYPA